MNRARAVAWWIVPSLVCLAIEWPGFTAWFRGDDFAWLGLGAGVHSLHDLLAALFHPFAQGTIRPLSERAFFLVGFWLFGMDPLPFRIVIFATQFANLALMAAIERRITGSAAAGFAAAIFWAISDALVLPLGWVCVYNQVMCAFFLLLAFYFMLRGNRMLEWIAFLLGFGAMELNVVYPVLAIAYAPRQWRRKLPMFAVSIAYAVMHYLVAHPPGTGEYAFHWTGAMLRTLGVYWTWSVGPVFLWTPFVAPAWLIPAGVALISAGLLAWLVGRRTPLFFLGWFVITIAPVLPLRDHRIEYYIYVPVIGICWLGGWALADSWSRGGFRRAAAAALTLLYCAMVVPRTIAASRVNHNLTERVRNLVEGVASAHEQHPNQAILLDGVDTELFYNGIVDRPFRALGIYEVYLTPGSEGSIAPHPEWGDPTDFVLTPNKGAKEQLVVYDVRGLQLRNITSQYLSRAVATEFPRRIDAANPLEAYLLGPEWYGIDGDHRWMGKRASFRIGDEHKERLYLHGYCPEGQLSAGPLPVRVTINGVPSDARIHSAGSFDLSFVLPNANETELWVVIEVGRTFRAGSDTRDLGLAFGTFEVR